MLKGEDRGRRGVRAEGGGQGEEEEYVLKGEDRGRRRGTC